MGILNPHLGIVRVKSFMLKFSQFDQLHDFCMNFYGRVLLLHLVYTKGNMFWHPATFSRCFSCKTPFLKWIFEADPVGVQIRTVSHFNGLKETFKIR